MLLNELLTARTSTFPVPFSIQQSPQSREAAVSTWTMVPSTSAANTVIEDHSDVAIAVMGATGSGKTSFINLASGSELRIGRGLRSCTNIIQVAEPFKLDGRTVTLIDTPGFDDTTKSDADILKMIAAFLAVTYEHNRELAGVIYIHRISDFRMTGISTRNFKLFRELCGDKTLQNVVILTNMWGEVSPEVGEARENELKTQDLFFKPALEKGAQILRHDNSKENALNVLRHLLDNHPLPLRIQQEMVDEGKEITETAAGAELNKELMDQLRKHRAEMRELQDEMKEALRAKDEQTRQELEIESKKLTEKMDRVKADAEKLQSTYSEDKRNLEEKLQEFQASAARERKEAAEKYDRALSNLRQQLEEATSGSDRAELKRQISELEKKAQGGGFFTSIGRAIDRIFGIH